MVFPTHTLYWLAGGIVLIYFVLAMVLTPAGIHLLPVDMVKGMVRSQTGFAFALLGIPCGLYLILWRAGDLFYWMFSPSSLELDARGIHVGKTSVLWRDMTSIVREHNNECLILAHRGSKYRLRLHLWSDSDELEAVVTQQVISMLLPVIRRQVVRGEQVGFGPLSVRAEGLVFKKKLIEWDDIESLRLQDDFEQGVSTRELHILANGRLHKIDEEKILNAPVLFSYLSDRLAG
ncbi:hypothetical protein LXT21_26035 [Myxococcus sp. K38C18041901]|uniref:DUF6585 family protein n=1 Tax=Myxococcus guangdongensis TaxID=2906760 RepID=UPI0020A826D7|nr:DUF6585 family protein [Myxococcus guangdongensis]MCP3062254.1 hypothetical protein [Myxococcus guangdongensis]